MGRGRADHCDICHKRVLRSTLVKVRVPTEYAGQANYLQYSSYDSSWWSLPTGSYDGAVANGLQPGRVRVKNDNSTEIIDGSPQFTGTAQIVSGAVDLSGASTAVFSFWFGISGELSGSGTLEYGFTKSDGTGGVTDTITVDASRPMRPYLAVTSAQVSAAGLSLASLYVSVKFTPPSSSTSWWIDGLQLERDVSEPGDLVITNGSSLVYDSPTVVWSIAKACPRCIDRPLKRTGAVYVPKPDVKTPIPVHLE